jgi:hypothetical protein
MAELKTKPTKESALKFLQTIEPETKRADSLALLKLFKDVTGEKPIMWGEAMIGFGMFHYKSERSTQEGDWPLVAFSPRKQNLTLYVLSWKKDNPLLEKLGKYKRGGGCLYINKLSDVDLKILTKLIKTAYQEKKKQYKVK